MFGNVRKLKAIGGKLVSNVWQFVTDALNSMGGYTISSTDHKPVSSANFSFWNVVPFAMAYGFSGILPSGNTVAILTKR